MKVITTVLIGVVFAPIYPVTSNCVLFTGRQQSQVQHPIADNAVIANLPEFFEMYLVGSDTIEGLHINNGCTAQICNETYFNGECHLLRKSRFLSTARANLSSIKSLNCICPKVKVIKFSSSTFCQSSLLVSSFPFQLT